MSATDDAVRLGLAPRVWAVVGLSPDRAATASGSPRRCGGGGG